jgi:hypothetical protein
MNICTQYKLSVEVSGLLMGGLGLSSGLFTFLYGWLFAHSEVVYYLAFLGGVCLVIGVFGSLNMSKVSNSIQQTVKITQLRMTQMKCS